MPYYNVYLTIKGPAGIVETPSGGNPIYADTMKDLLIRLANYYIHTEPSENKISLPLEIVGTRIEQASN